MGTTTDSVENWATPNTMDHLALRSDEALERQANGARKGRVKPANLREQVDKKSCEIYSGSWPTPDCSDRRSKNSKQQGLSNKAGKAKGKNLNPDWVETLQGLPVGTTQLSADDGTDLNRVDRLRLLGNGVVPQTACKAFCTLILEM